MASKKRPSKRSSARQRSYMNNKELYLHPHDEDKLLLFATGIIFGIGIAASLIGALMYSGVVFIIIALVLIYLEYRQNTIHAPRRR